MRVLFTVFLLSIINVSIASTSSTYIFNANVDGDAKKWKARGENFDVKVIPWPDKLPGKTLHVTFPRSTVKNQWPAIIMSTPDLLEDWKEFESLNLDFFIEGKDAVPLKIYLKTAKTIGRIQLNLKPGRNSVSIPKKQIDQQIDCSGLKSLHLYFARPTQKYTINLGAIRLIRVNRDSVIRQYKTKFERLVQNYKVKKTRFDSEKGKAEFEAQLAEFKKLLKTLADSDSNSFTDYRDKCEEVLAKLNNSLQTAVLRAQAGDNDLTWIWNSSMSKVLLNGNGLDNTALDYTIKLAKNEREGATLVIYPLVDLSGVSWEVGDFISNDGGILRADNITVNPCGYIKCNATPYIPRQKGVYRPDPILTYCRKLDIKKLTYQSFYIEAKSSAKQQSGIFSGKITFRAKGKIIAQIPLKVQVWDFSLKSGSTLPLAMSWREPYQPQIIPSLYIKDKKQKQEYIDFVDGKINLEEIKGQETLKAIGIRKALIDLFLEHRLSPDSLYRNVPPSVSELKYLVGKGANHFNISYNQYKLPDMLKEIVPVYRKNKLLDKAYIYLYDEADKHLWPEIQKRIRKIKEVNAEIPIITTAYDHTLGVRSGLEGLIDIWVVSLDVYNINLKSIHKAQKSGKKVWWYVACGPFAPYPNFFIEYPSIGQRLLMGVMSQKFNNQGFLYYSLAIWKDFWQDSNKKWHSKFKTTPMTGAPVVSYNAYSYRNFNGDGNLIYPGPEGAVPSLRLKQFRDGLEDYQYIEILKGIAERTKNEKVKDEAEKLLNSAYSLVNNDFSYGKDTDKFNTVRSLIGDFIEKNH